MYLKSLALKGFKSFADRSVLTLEPGITAIVGPNGSGKSNISDAVLWVLGERNPRHLRGSSMEDVIFSGSSARKPVSFAEVELVLDNSDHMLPVDFDEVSVSRRMYRSGESEYLVNGVVSRRMDVLDILHDTGLGAGTHTIISQGNLDQILQSKPEDRRALIEEAAGVLKHKQRKEKSERKLATMDMHLTRVGDVVAEINRQLGPLERKAKRAKAYQEASARLREVKLALAVDDLRNLQGQWERLVSQEGQLASELEQQRENVTRAQQSVNDIQELIRTKAASAGELARDQRRATSISERLDGAVLLLKQKRQSAGAYEADVLSSVENAKLAREEAVREREGAQRSLEEVQLRLTRAQDNVDDIEQRRQQAVVARNDAQRRIEELERDQRQLAQECERARRDLTQLKESLSSGVAQEKLYEARRIEVEAELARATSDYDAQTKAFEHAQERLFELEAAEKSAQAELAAAFEARAQAKARFDARTDEERVLNAEIKAVKQSLSATRSAAPALAWLMDNAQLVEGDLVPFAHALGAPRDIESLVEHLLGDDLSALMVRDAHNARTVCDLLLSQRKAGDVSVVLKEDAFSATVSARTSKVGVPLVDKLNYSHDAARIVESLLGDVVLCDSRDQAFAAHASDTVGLRFVTADGCAIWPQGKVIVYGAVADEREGVLARERRLSELESQLAGAREAASQAEGELQSAEGAYATAQERSLHASQEHAQQKGSVEAASTAQQRAQQRVKALANDFESVRAQLERAAETLNKIRPDVEMLEASIEDKEREREQLASLVAQATEEVAPLRRQAGGFNDELVSARLELATLKERLTYAQRMVTARDNDIAQASRTLEDAAKTLVVKRVAQMRALPVLDTLEKLSESLRARMSALDDAMLASQNLSDGFQVSAEQARRAAQVAQEALDGANSRMTNVQVEKGRMEVLVQTAVSTVVDELSCPLEVAEEMPQLEERPAYEQEAVKLTNRIKNMGVINPDAAEEYEKLKKRYDFLMAQLDDVAAARKSLAKIVRLIDARMRDDFAVTFEKVNQNFNEVFSVLFPGGHAELVLDDPDDLEHTGVEVKAQPRGKRITKMTLMSGGEKSLTALALLFAIYRIRKTPFYILDEVEAALDDSNLRRLISYIDSLRSSTQLIMITHQRRSMEMADVLFGVSMQSDGVTKVLSQKLEHENN